MTDSHLVRLEMVSMILARGDPFIAIDTLRRTAIDRDLPNRRQLVSIINILKSQLVVRIRHECSTAKFVTLAADGWFDACSRRCQGVTGRPVYDDERIRTVVLSLKEVIEIHESAFVLQDIVAGVIHKYDIGCSTQP
jgi:hypothetical protein